MDENAPICCDCLVVGDFGVNCYLVAAGAGEGTETTAAAASRPCVVIDPGAEAGRIAAHCGKRGWRPRAILLTHAHYDHIGGVRELMENFPGMELACSAGTARRMVEPRHNLSPLLVGRAERAPDATRIMAAGASFALAGLEWAAREIPGHDPGELVYHLPAAGRLFAGDTIFAGGIGRSDFPGGDGRALVAALRECLAALPPETTIHPGHGPATTVADELRSNPFLIM